MSGPAQAPLRVAAEALEAFAIAALAAIGADKETAEAATRAMMHGSKLGVDSHGIRLLDHYVRAIEGGRIKKNPTLRFVKDFGSTAVLDADDGHGALATYTAMDKAMALARYFGIGAVAIRNSSHIGAAGAYALAAAKQGLIGFCVCNSDAIVRLHDGAMKFHGTNPIAFAVPVKGSRPWLLDLATSAIPMNRVNLYRSLGHTLPSDVASDSEGRNTDDPHKANMLAPLGGAFSYKGAGLAGMVEILSCALTGMRLSAELPAMMGEMKEPRHLGAFVAAIEPSAFIEQGAFDATMTRYLEALRSSPSQEGFKVMAPGDREWVEADTRERDGIPLDPETVSAFEQIAARFRIAPIIPANTQKRGAAGH
jgi:LDH2 family malate/lactate/ureidoglycolate dehydrogenase